MSDKEFTTLKDDGTQRFVVERTISANGVGAIGSRHIFEKQAKEIMIREVLKNIEKTLFDASDDIFNVQQVGELIVFLGLSLELKNTLKHK